MKGGAKSKHCWDKPKKARPTPPNPNARKPTRLSNMSSLSLRTREEMGKTAPDFGQYGSRGMGPNGNGNGSYLPQVVPPMMMNRGNMNPMGGPPNGRAFHHLGGPPGAYGMDPNMTMPGPGGMIPRPPTGGNNTQYNFGRTAPAVGDRAMGAAPMARSFEAQEAARARAALIDRERRQIFGYLSSPNCYLFSEVQGAVSLTEEDLDLLLAAGGTSSATLTHLRHLDARGKKFGGFSDLIPAVQAAHLASLENKKDILAFLSGPRCGLFGKTPTIFVTVSDVDRLVDEGGAGPDTLRYLKAFDKAGEKYEVFNDLILAVRDAHLEAIHARRRKAPTDTKTEEDRQKQRHKDQDRKTVLAHLSNPNCKLFSEAREVKAVASELDKLIEEGRTVPETILLLQDLDEEGRKFHKFSHIIPAVREARSKRAERLLEADNQRQKLFGYLSSPTCTLFSDARGEVKATATDLDRVLEEGGNSVPETIHLLKNLDSAGRKFANVNELIPCVKDGYLHDEKKKQADEAERVRQSVLEYLTSPESEFFTDVDDIHVTKDELDRLVGEGGTNTLFHLKHLNGQGRKFDTFQQLIYAVKAACIHAVENKRELFEWLSAPSREIFEPESDVTITPDNVDRLYIEGYAGPDTLPYLQSFEDNGEKFKTHHHLIAAVKNAHLWAIERRKQNQLDKIASDKNRKRVIAFLSRDDCQLFNEDVEDIHVKKADLDVLIREGGTVSDTLFFLNLLNRSSQKYEEFTDLLPAVRDLARDAAITKKRLYEKLSDPECKLWYDPDEVLVSESDIDRLFLESGSGSDAVDYIADFESDRKRFHFFDDLVLTVKKAHDAKLVAQEQDDKEAQDVERKQMKRDAILAHLSSPTCTIFSEAEDVHVNDEDLDSLCDEGGTVGVTLLFLKHLDGEGQKFMSFDQLLLAIGECRLRAENDKVQLLNYLTSPQCRLLADAPDELKLTLEDMDRLYEEGTAGPQTIFHLMDMMDASKRLKSFDQLIENTQVAHADWVETRLAIKNMTHSHLTGPICTLFYDAQDIRDAQLNRLLAAGRTGPATILHIESLEAAGRMFETIDQLIPAVEDCNNNLSARKRQVLEYFNSPHCKLMGYPHEISTQEVDRLFVQGAAGPETLVHLRAFSAANRKFGSFERLIDAVKTAHLEALDKDNAERLCMITHLCGPKCNLFDVPVIASSYDLDRLIEAGGARGSSTLNYVEELDAMGHKFGKFDDLVAAVKALHKEETERKQKLLWRLKSPSCQLFSIAPAGLADSLTMQDMDNLFAVGRDGRRTVYYIGVFDDNKAKFVSFDEVLRSVEEAHRRTLRAMKDEKAMIFAHLSSDASVVLADEVVINDRDLDRLFKVGGSGPAIIFHLERLEEQGKVYDSMPALIHAVRASHLSSVERKEELYAHFRHPRCKLFSTAPGGVNVTREDVDRLYTEGDAGPETLIHLWAFGAAGRKFNSFPELIIGVRDAHTDSLERAAEERLMILAHLSRPKCALFPAPIQASAEDLDDLIRAGSSPPATLFLLERLEADGAVFDTFDDLVNAVKFAQDSSIDHKRELLRYLIRPECSLFRDAPYEVKVTPHNVNRLYEKGRAGPMTLDHVKALDARSERYGSFHHYDELIEAVKRAHIQALKKARAERKAKEEAEALQRAKDLQRKLAIEKELAEQVERANRAAAEAREKEAAARALQLEAEQREREAAEKQAEEEARRRREAAAEAAAITARSVNGRESGGGVSVSGLENTGDLGLDGIEEAKTQAEKDKFAVLTYLTSPRRKFFIGAPVAVTATADDVESLAGPDCSYAAVLLHLEYLDADGAKFNSMEELAKAVKDRNEAAKIQKGKLLDYLKSDKCLLMKNAADAAALTPKDMNRVMEEGRAGVYTRKHLEDLQKLNVQFASVDELVDAVAKKHIDAMNTIKSEKYMILAHLSSPKCALFSGVVKVSDADLDEMLAAGRSGASTLGHLEALDNQKAKFGNVKNVIDAIESNYASTEQAKEKIAAFLNSPDSDLFNDATLKVSPAQVSDLYEKGVAGDNTYVHLWALQKSGAKFDTPQQLAAAVKASQMASQEKIKAEKLMILTHLSGPQCSFFNEAFKMTSKDLDNLYEAGETGHSCLYYLRGQEDADAKFNNIDDLVVAVKQDADEANGHKDGISAYLNSPANELFSEAPENVTWSKEDVAKLYEGSQGKADILPIIKNWDVNCPNEEDKSKFDTFDDLSAAVTEAIRMKKEPSDDLALNGDKSSTDTDHGMSPEELAAKQAESTAKQKDMVLCYMRAPQRNLLPADHPALTEDEVSRLFDICGSGPAALYHVRCLENEGKKFATVDEMLAAIAARHNDSDGQKKGVKAFMASPMGTAMMKGIPLTDADVEMLFSGDCDPAEIEAHLWSFAQAGRTFDSPAELRAALEEASRNVKNDPEAAQRFMLKCALCSAPLSDMDAAKLLQDGSGLTDAEIDAIIANSGNAVNALLNLSALEGKEGGPELFSSPEALAAALAAKEAESKDQRNDILEFLTSDGCDIFADAAEPVVIDEPVCERIYNESGAGDEALRHLKVMNANAFRCDTVDQLIDGVIGAHQQFKIEEEEKAKLIAAQKAEEARLEAEKKAKEEERKAEAERKKAEELEKRKGQPPRPKSRQRPPRRRGSVTEHHRRQLVSQLAEHLSDPEITLFDPEDAIHVTQDNLNDLSKAAGTIPSALYHIDNFAAKGVVFHTFDQFIESVRDEQTRLEALQDEALAKLKDPTCKLLAGLPDHMLNKLNGEDMKRMFDRSGAHGDALTHLETLQAQGLEFDNVNQLTNAIKDLQQKRNKNEKLQKAHTLSFLRSPTCDLLSGNADKNNEFNEAGVNKLFANTDGDAGPLFTIYLRNMQEEGEKYPSMDSISEEVQKRHADIEPKKESIRKALKDGQLFNKEPKEVSDDDLVRILNEGGNDVLTPAVIWYLNHKGETFDDVDDLVGKLQEEHLRYVLDADHNAKMLLLAYLSSPECYLFNVNVEFGDAELDDLYSAGDRSTTICMYYLEFLNNVKRASYVSIQELIDAVIRARKEEAEDKNELLLFLSSPLTGLFLEADEEVEVEEADIERLFAETGAGPENLKICMKLDEDGARFDTFDDLVVAVRKAYLDAYNVQFNIELPVEDQSKIIEYLSSGDCLLFSEAKEDLTANENDLKSLVYHGQGVEETLNHLTTFNNCHRRFNRFIELTPAVKHAVATGTHASEEDVVKLNNFIDSNDCQVFGEKASEELQIAGADLDAAIIKAGGLEKLIIFLITCSKQSIKCNEFADIIPMMKDAPKPVSTEDPNAIPEASDEDRNALIEFVSSEKCVLFSDIDGELSVTSDDIDALIHEGGGLKGTLKHLNLFNEAHRSFKSFQSLIPAIKLAISSGSHVTEETRQKIVEFLTNECNLFSETQSLEVTATDLDAVCIAGHGLQGCIEHFKQYEQVRRSFSSFHDLVPAMQATKDSDIHIDVGQVEELRAFLSSDECTVVGGEAVDFKGQGSSVDELVIAVKKFEAVIPAIKALQDKDANARFTNLHELAVALGAPSASGAKVDAISDDDRQAVVQYLTEGSLLFADADDIQVEQTELDTLIHSGGGREACIGHMKKFDDAGRRFDKFTDLVPAIKTAIMDGSYVHDDDRMAIVAILQEASIFEGAAEELQVNAEDLDELVYAGKGSKAVVEAIKKLDNAQSRFNTFHEMVPAVKNVLLTGVAEPKTKITPTPASEIPEASDEDRQALAERLGDLDIFSENTELQVSAASIDGVIFEGKGIDGAIAHLTKFQDTHRKFDNFDDIPYALKIAVGTNTHIDPEDAHTIKEYLKTTECRFGGDVNDEKYAPIQPSGPELDELITACLTGDAVMNILRNLNALDKRFANGAELVAAAIAAKGTGVSNAGQANAAITDDDRQALAEVLGDTNLFSETAELVVDAEHLDQLLTVGSGINGCKQHLASFDEVGRKFTDIADIIPAIKEATEAGSYVGDEQRNEVVGYLTENNSFFESADDMEVSVEDLDALIKTAHGAAGVVAHLKTIAATGQKFKEFHELVPAVASLQQG